MFESNVVGTGKMCLHTGTQQIARACKAEEKIKAANARRSQETVSTAQDHRAKMMTANEVIK